jgi:hypothetical protein
MKRADDRWSAYDACEGRLISIARLSRANLKRKLRWDSMRHCGKEGIVKSPLNLLIWILVAMVAAAAMACREEGSDMYLDGKQLVAPLEVFELQGGVVGFTGTYFAIEPDGAWLSGPILPGKGEKGAPIMQGILSSTQLVQLSEQLHRHQLSTLADHGAPAVNPRVVKIKLGQEIRVLNPKPGKASIEEDRQIRNRYDGILSAVKAMCTPSDAGASP